MFVAFKSFMSLYRPTGHARRDEDPFLYVAVVEVVAAVAVAVAVVLVIIFPRFLFSLWFKRNVTSMHTLAKQLITQVCRTSGTYVVEK